MKDQDKSPKELLKEFEALNKEYNSLKARYEKDISERDNAEENLRESEERLKLAQQMAHIGNWELNLNTSNLKCSDEIFRIYEIDPEQFNSTYDELLQCIHPDDIEEFNKAYKKSLTDKTPYKIDHRLLMNDGRIKYVHEQCLSEFDSEGNAVISRGTVQDITERKMIENALFFITDLNLSHRGSNFFTTLARYLGETLSVDYVVIDRVVEGKNAHTLANYQLGEICPNIEYPLKDTPCENIYDNQLCSFPENIQKDFPNDSMLVDLNAESYSGIPLWDSNGVPLGLIAVIHRQPLHNINRIEALLQIVSASTGHEIERLEAEKKLHESEEKYRNIFKNVQDVFYRTDLNGNVIEISPSIKNLSEFNRDEIIGKPVHHLYDDPNDREVLLKTIKKHGELKDYELRLKTKSGKIKYVSINARLISNDDESPKQINGAIRDITARKMAEAELSASEKRFKQVAESAGEWIWEVDENGLYTYASPVVEKILGYTPDELIGKKHYFDLFNSATAEETQNSAKKLFAEKKPLKELINQNVHKNGTLVWLSTSGSPILDDDGNLLGYHGVDTDITDRKLAQEALKESEFFFKESQKAAFIGSYKTDFIEGQWESSAVLDEIFGIDKNYDRTVQGWLDIVHPHDREMMYNYFMDEVMEKHNPFNKEYRIIRKNDGQVRWVHGQGIVSCDDRGNVISLIGTIQDITERRLDEYQIRKLNYAVEATSEVVFMTDKDGIFTFVNPAFTAVYGYQADDVIGKVTPRLLKSGHMDASAYDFFWKELLSNRVIQGELVNKTEDGRKIYIEGSANAIIDESGEIIGFIAIQKDITARKQIENELLSAKENAEVSDRLKSSFLSNMSHEIRTPMNGILGFAELLQDTSLTKDELQEYTQAIQVSGKRMLNTINSIIDVSKIESGLIKVDINETNINEALELIYKFFKPESENKGLQFSFITGLPAGKALIKTDYEKVYGVLTNLVKNAVKFTDSGSIKFGYRKKGKYLEFFVEDTGQGIQKNLHEIIFERFRQGSESYNRGYEGSGLGLSICKSYVKMLGGKIWLESDEGTGTKFYFTIPYNPVLDEKAKRKDSVISKQKELNIKNLKILIVEDDELSYSYLLKCVQTMSKEVLHAITGAEAVTECKNHSDIDLILMDIQMPEMNGYEATREIRQFNNQVVIVAQTAYGLIGDREKSIKAGCNEYISKPIDKDKLMRIIQKHFNGHSN
jgi:PAS domain S-box-containing protein